MTKRITIALAFITGAGMIFIGVRFFLFPETAETGYGIHFNDQGDYSFHYIKGIRDVFTGLLLCLFVLMKERRALALTLVTGAMIPIADLMIVLSKNGNGVLQAMPHIIAIITCLVLGSILLTGGKTKGKTIDGLFPRERH